MNRRILEDRINQNTDLGNCGIDANLIFDRLLTITDDAGLAPGEPFIIKAQAFPFLDAMTPERIAAGLRSLTERNLVYARTWRGRIVIAFNPKAFQEIQRLRKDYNRRFNFGELSQLTYSQGLHGFRSDAEREPFGCRPETVRTSSTISSTTTTTTTTTDSSEPLDAASELSSPVSPSTVDSPEPPEPPEPAVMVFPCIREPREWGLTQTKIEQYQQTYPGINVPQECCRARQWCIDNAPRRKTARGMPSFLNRWLERAQNRGVPTGPPRSAMKERAAQGVAYMLEGLTDDKR